MNDPTDLRPWTVAASRHIVRDRWIRIRADDCVTAEGVPIAPYYVLEYPDWVHVVALDAEDRVLLTRQYRHGLGRVSLELPCGSVEPDDAGPEEAARRELLEETGHGGDFTLVGRYSPNPATHSNTLFVFLARNATRLRDPEDDPGEVVHHEFAPLADLARLIDSGAMTQAMHLGSLFMALRHAGLLGQFV